MKHDSEDYEFVVFDDNLSAVRLSAEEKRRLICEPKISDFQRNKLEKDAKKNWDLFYKRNGARFFKPRYWTLREFSELYTDPKCGQCIDGQTSELRFLLEIGCGCGDFALPLLDRGDSVSLPQHDRCLPRNLFIYCCDISDKAIEILTSNPIYKRFELERIKAFVGNVLEYNTIKPNLDNNQMDYISLIFVLSALDPSKLSLALDNIYSNLKPGGLIFFRDYAIYDKAMLRFNEKSKIQDQFYVRQDGTRAYFFTKTELEQKFREANFECDTIDYVKRETINNVTGTTLNRIFLQAKFRRRK